MNVFKPGTKVKLLQFDLDEIIGIVCAINITKDRIIYEISYLNGNSRHKEWFDEFEIAPFKESSVERIGFK